MAEGEHRIFNRKFPVGWLVAAVSIGVNIGGLAGTYTVLNNTQAAQAVQINDHESRLRAQDSTMRDVANDVKWIKEFMQKRSGAGQTSLPSHFAYAEFDIDALPPVRLPTIALGRFQDRRDILNIAAEGR